MKCKNLNNFSHFFYLSAIVNNYQNMLLEYYYIKFKYYYLLLAKVAFKFPNVFKSFCNDATKCDKIKKKTFPLISIEFINLKLRN